ncbi:MAG: DUF6498-containing protein [Saprospiraceae bacterium]|nr:DUF6498-containing protein [Saprospiraceae bacterium]
MLNDLLSHPLLQKQRAWWLPFLSLGITLYGIGVLGWNLFPIIFLFWWEVILMVGAALVRMFFSLDGRGFLDGLFQRVFLLVAGGVLGGAMVMFAVTFSINGIDTEGDWTGFGNIAWQTRLMTAGAVLGLVFHFFANGRFRTATPFGELMATFAHLLVLLALLMVFTMHLIPTFPQLQQAKWVAVAVVVVKFGVDMAFLRVRKHIETIKESPQGY